MTRIFAMKRKEENIWLLLSIKKYKIYDLSEITLVINLATSTRFPI
jgi:hypothetical protein